MAGSRRRERGPSAPRFRRPRGSWSYARAARCRALRGGRAGGARRRRPARASRSRCRRASTSPRRCTPACCSARSPCPSTCACRRPSARASPTAPPCSSRSRWRRAGPCRPGSRSRAEHDLDATARRDPHLGHHRRAAAGGADLRQLPVERARLGRGARPRSARALAVRAAALARRRAVDTGALGDLRDDGGRARALRDRPRRCTRCASRR